MNVERGTFRCSRCGAPHQRYRDRAKTRLQAYCLACHAAYMRENRPKHSELPAEARMKATCRAYAKVYLRRGKLVRQPCRCGNPASQMHHRDYSQPLEVQWLCRPCHLEEHRP